jgi:hypothetical protein
MATVLLLQHRDDAERYPPVHLTLTGATVVSVFAGRGPMTPSIQILPSREAAEEHLERILRLRRDEGYGVVERREVADGEVEPIADPMLRLFRYDAARGRAKVVLSEGPVSPEQITEIVARLAATTPACLDYWREDDDIPAGLFSAALAGTALPSVKDFVFGTYTDTEHDRPPIEDLADFFAALPNLRRADTWGRFALREARHGGLVELRLEGRPLFAGPVAALGEGSLPALATLDVVLGKDHGLDRAIAAALRSLDAPRLRTVEVAGLADVTRFLAELTGRPLPPSWETLYVQGSVGDEDELLAVLRDRAPALGSVALLALPLADELSEGGIAGAKALLPQLADVGDLPALWPRGASDAW